MLARDVVEYLNGRFQKGDLVLFTGAGFSSGALNTGGTPIPSVTRLKELLWQLVYPDLPFELPSLQDIFELARTRALGSLRDLLLREFTVDRLTIPEDHKLVFDLPWHRVYTLNIDDLDEAVAATSSLRRRLTTLSPANLERTGRIDGDLEVFHLNGMVRDGPNAVTFSTRQMSEHYPGRDPLHAQAAVDLLARPVVYVGTELEEPPLWQHITLRGRARGKDLRRRSFLVTPRISRARKDFLERELHVEHLPISLEEFVDQALKPAIPAAASYYQKREQTSLWSSSRRPLSLVSQLAAAEGSVPAGHEYLLGFSPRWSDLMEGRAAERDFEDSLTADILELVRGSSTDSRKPITIITGTAGSGKTTTCMRLGLRLAASGVDAAWIDDETDASPHEVRTAASLGELPPVVIIDDADRYGSELPLLASDIAKAAARPLVVIGVRSGRVERIADRLTMLKVSINEVVLGLLTDGDIGRILDVLEDNHRLGELRGLSRAKQIAEFRNAERAARQLLVAMLEVTSGRRFVDKIAEELDQLSGEARYVYGMVAIATAYRFGLTRDQILLGVGDASNESLRAIDDLARRMLLVQRTSGEFRVRHRVVGEKLVDHMIGEGALFDPLLGLAISLATQLGPLVSRDTSKAYRSMRVLMNHDWLKRALGADRARQFLADLEGYMNWDHHYWLQRGSLELEYDNDSLAENALNQAAAIEPRDLLVKTEIAYLRLKQAVAAPNGVESRELLEEGLETLREVMASRRHFDPHQYDILGRMVLRWIYRSDVTTAEREDVLRDAADTVARGRALHPRDDRLREVWVALQNERIGHPTVIRDSTAD